MLMWRANRRSRRRHATRGAVTLEVLVAVAVVMMVGAVAILSFGGSDRARLHAEAADVALFLQRARMRALESGKRVEIVVSEKERLIDAGGEQFHLDRAALSASRDRLLLHPSGESPGLILQLQNGDEVAEVSLDWLTGRVTWQ